MKKKKGGTWMNRKRVTAVLSFAVLLIVNLFLLLPQKVHAGGAVDINGVIKGVNKDGTVDYNKILLVYLKDLDAKYGNQFSTLYAQGKVGAGFCVGSADKLGTYNDDKDGKYFAYYISPDKAGQYLSFETWTNADDTGYNNNTSSYKIVAPSSSSTSTSSPKGLTKPTLRVTKISKNKVGLRWSSVSGATGYRIYKNGKVIMTKGGSTTTALYTKKKAGKAKYRVAAIQKAGGKVKTGPLSAVKKGAKNQKTYFINKNINSVSYSYAPFKISKISLEGKTYKITGYVVNNRIYKMLRYQKLQIKIFCNGKLVAKKKFKNLKKAKCKASGIKKVTLKIKGKGGVDFRNAQGITWQTSTTPYWEYVGTKVLK